MLRGIATALALGLLPLVAAAACGSSDNSNSGAGATGTGGKGTGGSKDGGKGGTGATGGANTGGANTGGANTGGANTGGANTGGTGNAAGDASAGTGGGTGGSSTGGGDGGLACPYTGPPLIDPATFAECSPACSGAHCVPAALVPQSAQSLLSPCTATGGGAGFCAPDPFIAAGGNFVPPTCVSVAGAEGRCVSTCLPDVAAQAALLPVSTCAAGERCAPCFNPTAADPTAPTGACTLSCDKPAQPPLILTCPWTGPDVIDPASLPACGPSGTSCGCLPAAFVPTAQQSQLAACTGGFCAPADVIKTGGNDKPPGCAPFAGVTSASDGRCLSECLPAVSSQPTLEQSSCASGSKCAPCYDPFSGAATGACSSSSCDAPPATAYTFASCCMYQGSAQGKCVPTSQIPDTQEPNLKQDVCPSASTLCVPSEQLPGGSPIACTATFPLPGAGTCLSDCLNLGFGGVLLGQGSCPANHKCVPCSLAPAGTPGC